jgi:hypothetical protein
MQRNLQRCKSSGLEANSLNSQGQYSISNILKIHKMTTLSSINSQMTLKSYEKYDFFSSAKAIVKSNEE